METSVIDKYIIGRVEPQIYAFSTETVPNYLKVGDTYRPIEQRLQEWRKYFPDLKEHYEAVAKVGKETYFRDFAIHYFLEHDKNKHRLLESDIPELPYYSREFFKETSKSDVADAIEDIKRSFASNDGKYQFYTFDQRPTPITYTYKRGDKAYQLRPNQQETVDNFKKAVKKGRTNLLMYAVMRFGKTFTALSCAKSDARYKAILVVSGKADVKDAWKKTTESIKNFEGFEFIDSDELARDNKKVSKVIAKGHRAVVFLTLQDLSGSQIKRKHRFIFQRTWDLLIIDETHYGARAEEYGKVLNFGKKQKKEKANEDKYIEKAEDYDNNEDLKLLKAKIRLHLSGTPYRILMSSEFQKEDIIAFYQFSDIVRDKDKWDADHINDDDCNEWDNPYFGFPQMVRFAFNVNESSMRKMEALKKSGVEYALNELLRPQSTLKTEEGKHLLFNHEPEVLELLMAIDGSKEDDNLFSFLDYDKIKEGKLCRHIVCVLPYRASCDAMEALINKNKTLFKNLGQYEILNIAGVENESSYPESIDVTNKITECERNNKKTLTLTVNRMLTGTTVPEWDTMIYLKDTASPQEYDQATFRLQNQYIKELKDSEGNVVKYNMKPQTLLVDFEPGRMFRMQEAKSQIYNVNTDKRGNSKLVNRIAEELRISPIITINKDKMCEVKPNNILDKVKEYSASKSIMDEATDIPADRELLDNSEILNALEPLMPIDSKKGLREKAYKGKGSGLDIPGTGNSGGNNKEHTEGSSEQGSEDKKEYLELQKKLKTYYSLILFFAFLTNSKVNSLEDVLHVIDANPDNQRIARNVGINNEILQVIQTKANPFVLRDLDYKISNMNQLARDKSVKPAERAERAMNKFGRLSTSEIITPANVARFMVKKLPDGRIKKGTKILDIAAKQGEFAIALYNIYGNKIKDSVYSLPTSPLTYEFTRKVYSLLGMPTTNVMRDYTTYDLLRTEKKDKLTEMLKELEPNIIISNPPYQDNAVGEQKTFNGPIYNRFMDISYDLTGTVEMIHPARFLTNAGSTPKSWNQKMLEDPYFSIVGYKDSSDDIFSDTDIKGGVAISLRDTNGRKHEPVGKFIRFKELDSILGKVTSSTGFKPMSEIVVSRTAYRFTELMHEEHPEAIGQLSEGHPYDVSTNIFERLPQVFYDEKPDDGKDYIRILGRINSERVYKFVRRDYIRPVSNLDYYKVFLSKANGTGTFGEALTAPFIGEPGVGNTETFISIGKFETSYEAESVIKYIKTRFARTLLGTLKTTQDITPEKWANVPVQDFTQNSNIHWNKNIDDIDEELFCLYNLTQTERDFIKSMIKPME